MSERVPHHEPRAHVRLEGGPFLAVADVVRALPDPETLAPGTQVLVPETAPRAGRLARFFGALGGGGGVTRSLRCSALVARGYVDVGAAFDDATRTDVAWGFVPGPRASSVSAAE